VVPQQRECCRRRPAPSRSPRPQRLKHLIDSKKVSAVVHYCASKAAASEVPVIAAAHTTGRIKSLPEMGRAHLEGALLKHHARSLLKVNYSGATLGSAEWDAWEAEHAAAEAWLREVLTDWVDLDDRTKEFWAAPPMKMDCDTVIASCIAEAGSEKDYLRRSYVSLRATAAATTTTTTN